MSLKLTDIYTAPIVKDNWTEVHSNEIPYLGAAMFPAQKRTGLDISWIKGNKGLPVSLMPSSFDAKPTFRDRIGVTKIETEMCFFREEMKINEKLQQDIMRCESSNDPHAKADLQQIFNDSRTLIDGARVVPERMIMQLLAPTDGNCRIGITANGISHDYNFDPDGSWKKDNYIALADTDVWSDHTNAKPLNDIRTVTRKAMSKGSHIGKLLMSQATFDHLIENSQIKSAILAQNATANIFLDDSMLGDFIKRKFGVTVLIYEKMYKDEQKKTHAFYPDGYVTFIPDGTPLGTTWFGTTPEERSGSAGNASHTIVDTGVSVLVYTTPLPPINTITCVSEIVLPSYERMDEVFVAKVF